MTDQSRLSDDLNRTGFEFLMADIGMGLTFAQAALLSDDPQKKLRNQAHARRAYDSVSRLSKRLRVSDAERRVLRQRLNTLKVELQKLGESI